MNKINDYEDDSFFTFETGIIGKEYLQIMGDKVQLIFPGFQVGLKINDDNIYFNKQYFLFSGVSYFAARISYFDSDIVNEYTINLCSNEHKIKIVEIESLSLREAKKTFCTYRIGFEKLDIYYDCIKPNYCYINSFENIITKYDLFNFLNLKEIPVDSGQNLSDLLIDL